MIKLLVPRLPTADAILPYLRAIDENRWYSNHGPLVKELEQRLSDRYAGAHVVSTSNGTSAIEIALTVLKEDGAAAIGVPALTFVATALAPRRVGLQVILDDVDPQTWSDGYVSAFGLPGEGELVDAAGAFGEQTVPPGVTATFSLHATKVCGAGEGGYIVTHDKAKADRYRRLTNFGILPDSTGRSEGEGTNAKMSEYAAAVALAALDAYDREPWLRLFDWYAEHLPADVTPQKRPRGVYSLMPVKLPVDACMVQTRMAAAGIECRRWYCPPLFRHKLFLDDPARFPVCVDLERHLLGLPYGLHLTERDVVTVCAALRAALALPR